MLVRNRKRMKFTVKLKIARHSSKNKIDRIQYHIKLERIHQKHNQDFYAFLCNSHFLN